MFLSGTLHLELEVASLYDNHLFEDGNLVFTSPGAFEYTKIASVRRKWVSCQADIMPGINC